MPTCQRDRRKFSFLYNLKSGYVVTNIMKAVIIFLLMFMHKMVSANYTDKSVLGPLGGTALLPCNIGGIVTPDISRWMKNGQEIITRNFSVAFSQNASDDHLTILNNGSLVINEIVLSDEGSYTCNSSAKDNNTVLVVGLHIVGVPKIESAAITPATHLSNGTLFVYKGSNVSFNCSGVSYPSQNLFWSFQGASSYNDTLASGSLSWLGFRIEDIQPSSQGVYCCIIKNPLSNMTANWSTQLLVYHAPDRYPECLWNIGDDPTHVQFNCSWSGGYPSPSLHWGENHHGPGNEVDGSLLAAQEGDSVVVTLNRSRLFDGFELKCQGHHPALSPGKEGSCSLSLKSPYPEGKPLITVLEGTTVTLICTEARSLPPASTTWRRTIQQDAVVPDSRFILSEEGPVFRFTIVNVTKEDEGFYFCRSENLLMVQELAVHLIVNSSTSAYTGAIIGIFLAVMIVGTGIISAKLMYSSRDTICLGNGFGRIERETGDIISLVESDEEVFHETVPRLPHMVNVHHTTLVEIHRIPSSEQEGCNKFEALK